MDRPQVAVQLIIFGERAQSDLPAVLADVSAAGYDGFEGGAPAGPEQVAGIRAAMADTSLSYIGGHCGEPQLQDPTTAKVLAEGVKALGGEFLICSGGSDWKTVDDCRRAAAVLNEAGAVCRGAGIALCYHNHFWEFKEIDGTKPIHALAEHTDPDLVKLCPDIYWVQVGGENPADFITRYRDRCPCLHFKDGLGCDQMREFRELGRGCVDIKAVLDTALAAAPRWIITEQDSTKGDPAESVRISRDYLKTLGL